MEIPEMKGADPAGQRGNPGLGHGRVWFDLQLFTWVRSGRDGDRGVSGVANELAGHIVDRSVWLALWPATINVEH